MCNDFSHATYYLDNPAISRKWVIFFEGGGGCSSFSSCNKRWIEDDGRNQALMSSSKVRFPQSVTGEDILSRDPGKNPQFYNYSHVLVPYCSSDAWLANRTHERFKNHEEFRFNETENADNFAFKGRVIFQSVVEDLLALPNNGLSKAVEIILAGSSSGGVGVLNNLPWVQEQLQSNVKVLVLIDSAWFIPFEGYHPIDWTTEQAKLLGINHDACLDVSLGFPCCTSPACLFTKGYLSPYSTPPVFAVSSMYDIFTLEGALVDLIKQIPHNDDQALLELFNSYGALMQQSFEQSYLVNSNLSLFTPSCSQHVYLATSTLWRPGAILNQTTQGVYSEGIFELSNPVLSGNWDRVQVASATTHATTLHQAIRDWHIQHENEHFFLSDECNGPICGQCPNKVRLTPGRNVWPSGLNIVVLLLSASMTIIPVSLKLLAYFHMKYMLYRQQVYAYSVQQAFQRRPQFPKAIHAVNVSCTELYYKVDTVSRSRSKEDEEQLRSPSSPQELQLKAKVKTFFPCFSRCVHSTSDLPEEKDCTSSGTVKRRSDSGISSIHHNSPHFQTEDTNSMATMLSSASSESGHVGTRPTHSSTTTLGHNLKKKTILRKVNLYINPGELVAVMGPSGSGKTTLLDVLLGRRTAGSTQVCMCGHFWLLFSQYASASDFISLHVCK